MKLKHNRSIKNKDQIGVYNQMLDHVENRKIINIFD